MAGGSARRHPPDGRAAAAALSADALAGVRRAAQERRVTEAATSQHSVTRSRLADVLFLATIFSVSFQNVYWNVAGRVNLADVLALFFLIAFIAGRISGRDRLVPRTTLIVLVFAAALLIVYLAGFFNIETKQALSLYEKGLTKFGIHFAFLAAGVAYLARRSEWFYWRTVGWFAAGFVANAAYGVLH